MAAGYQGPPRTVRPAGPATHPRAHPHTASDDPRDTDIDEGEGAPSGLLLPVHGYGNGPIRPFQSYLVKMPRAIVDLFPQLKTVVEALSLVEVGKQLTTADLLDDEVAAAAGRTARRPRSQGYLADQALRVAVEVAAMKAATDHYSRNWTVDDVHATESYDLCCTRGPLVKHVEVKGTTTGGGEVVLTPNEVAHARSTPGTALFVLRGIAVTRQPDGSVETSGGEPTIFDPWEIDSGTLRPVGYRYSLPESPTEPWCS